MNCFEVGPSFPTYKEAEPSEPSAEPVYVDVGGCLSSNGTNTLPGTPTDSAALPLASIPPINSAAIFSTRLLPTRLGFLSP